MKKFIFVPFLLFVVSVFAQKEKVDTVLNLQEVIVTGSRAERPLSQSPGRIDIITPLVLRHSPALSVDDILSMLSGVNTTRSSGMSTMHTNVSVRGLAGDEQGRTLVLFDGIPINTSDEGSVNWNSLPVDNIERIEVFKGPGSSLYGNNAMGGVINLISKKAERPFLVNASVSYGSLATWLYHLGISSKINDRFSVFVSGYYNRSSGFNNVPDSLRTDPDYSVARFMKEGGFYGKVLYTPSEWFKVDVSYDLYKDKRGEGEKIKAPDGEYRHFNHNRFQGRFYGGKKSFSYNVALYFQRQDYFKLDERITKDSYQRFDVKSHRDDWGAILHVTFSGKYNHFSIGAEYKNGSVDGGDYYVTSTDKVLNRGTMTFLSAFVQEEIQFFNNKFWLQVALRYDNAYFHKGRFEAIGDNVADFNTYNGDLKNNRWENFSPRLALRYNPMANLSVYVSYSKGFRASILDDLCRSGWMWVGPKIANPDLGPEKLDNYEIGGTFRFLGNFSFSPSFYYARGKDFLYYIATGEKMWGKRDIYQRQNISKVHVKGLEMDLNYSLPVGLHMNVNYSYNESKIKQFDEKPELNDKVLTYAPEHQVKGTVMWIGRIVNATIRGCYKTKQYTTEDNQSSIPGFAVWDVQLSKWFFDRRIYVGGEVMNIFNNRHMNTKDYISTGRLFNVKLAVNLMR
ncbi:TonB-dependent receptor plug domain-containing protein [Gabonibacter chumensis]|uniref:TonB-dependent receptor plug domain-containing protein n=1 Tax=Gabonibacter chumensis TaxID=2972474 RepID=UPI0025744C79|nr:TonB-dependent receptor [Gabonibacter chumensis]MCR9011658.1 TonB-dependent receptor [Gabonibacter chumensis]